MQRRSPNQDHVHEIPMPYITIKDKRKNNSGKGTQLWWKNNNTNNNNNDDKNNTDTHTQNKAQHLEVK